MKTKKHIFTRLAALVLAAFLAVTLWTADSYAWDEWDQPESTGNSKFDAFISDPEFTDDVYWPLAQHTKISKSGASGCASYAADFVKYCYGIDALTSKDSYSDPSQIRAGDVIHLTSTNSGHWFVVLKRDGNYLYTAEGNWASYTRIGWNYMIEGDNVLGSRHSFDKGYHFLPKEQTGTWTKDSDGWHFSYWEGSYVVNEWVKYNGSWYYLDEDGTMATGWKKLSGKWYYFRNSGQMHVGWKQYDGKWYYMAKNGAMVTGWRSINGNWYYFAGGAMVTGWRKLSGSWYYFSKGGVMQTGWRKYEGQWYYLDDGAMVAGVTMEIDGVEYTFGSDGVLIEEEEDTGEEIEEGEDSAEDGTFEIA